MTIIMIYFGHFFDKKYKVNNEVSDYIGTPESTGIDESRK